MKCLKCGFENRPDARFCKKCGQPLQAQAAPPAVPTPPGPVCPACGATAKPGARFCPRCGKPLPAEPGQPIPPSAQPPTPPPSRAQPSTSPSMPSATPPPSPPKRGPSRWVWVVGIIATLLCIAVLAIAAAFAVPKIIGGGGTATPSPTAESTPTETPAAEALPTETPTTTAAPPTATPTETPLTEPLPTTTPASAAFDAQVSIAPSATQLSTGDFLTITVTIVNSGQATFGNLRYQLLGEWESSLVMTTDVVVEQELDVAPGQSNTATFVLEAGQMGIATLQASVTMEVPDPPRFEGVLSDEIEIFIAP